MIIEDSAYGMIRWKQAAEELRGKGRAAAMDAAQDGIAIADEAGRIVYMNPAHRAMFGFEDEAE